MNLLLLIINIAIIASRRNQNPWVSALILTAVNLIGSMFFFLAYISQLSFFLILLTLLVVVIVYFLDFIAFSIANSLETESGVLYVVVFFVAQVIMLFLLISFVLTFVDLDDLEDRFPRDRDANTQIETRIIRNNGEEEKEQKEEEIYIPKEYNIDEAQVERCQLEKTELENNVEIGYRGITDFYHIDGDLVKYDSRLALSISDEDLRLEKAREYQQRYSLQYRDFGADTNELGVGTQGNNVLIMRKVYYYKMDLKKLFETSSRFRSATNSDYTIDFKRVKQNYIEKGWQCN